MITTRPLTATRGTGGDAITVAFYPDTGCLRFSDARGACLHELLPPHSWFAVSSFARNDQAGAAPRPQTLDILLTEFTTGTRFTNARIHQRMAPDSLAGFARFR
ncbi:hypothetical protein [Paraburkholderia saeva]|jgi:hypothetical protein|uniref:Uncharacterized protein n=1 Tax=Paraburkholderia saeva TaxID=2777537 RepID=A0A9N8X1B5_9BURK|nr:hypothetical protein [Paraburkholderia saeva]CAG4885625.1 hypothetical protein R52603_00022 [Paraburkholderia saeva]CAG4893193.1 hypothetical protein LMG31841_01644 [Paraburkholderia saeva]CAG4909074.1 hypothetical protein R70241_03688 [Paraburkholderia saeva]